MLTKDFHYLKNIFNSIAKCHIKLAKWIKELSNDEKLAM